MNGFVDPPYAYRGPFGQKRVEKAASTRSAPIGGVPGPIENEVPISQLPLAAPLSGAEDVAIVQNGISCRATSGTISGLAPGPVGPQGPPGPPTPVLISDTRPPLVPGALWFDSISTQLFFGYDDGTSVQWVIANNIGGLADAPPDGSLYGRKNRAWTSIGADTLDQMEALTVTTLNTLPNLLHTPTGDLVTLVLNGMTFMPVGSSPPFSVAGKTITWHSTVYSLNPGDSVAVAYSYVAGT